jgi:glutamyl-tRNA synthetase
MPVVRTRFAPSPTGYLHVGGIRTALFAWLVAQQAGGQFVLRLEDTDKNREVAGSAEHLIASLKTLGLDYDEGPDIGGPYAPYRQSDRLDTYKQWAQKLIDNGRAYADPYTADEVQAFREQAQRDKKPFLYRNHRPESPPTWDGSTPLRFKSDPKSYTWNDAVMGNLSTGPEVIDDFILIKSDGYPTYNFCHIVDDAEMEITHIIRGQEFISSMPNYLNLYEALGFDMSTLTEHERSARASGGEVPVSNSVRDQTEGRAPLPMFATMPHILNEQGNKKLGKRDGAKDVLDYVREGFLPDALVSFIATLGWNDGTEQEVFTRAELIQKFSLERVGRSGAHFDQRRLLWTNGHFIRNMDTGELLTLVDSFWPPEAANSDATYKRQVLSLVQERLKYFAELPELTSFFFTEPEPNMELISGNKQLKKLNPPELVSLLKQAHAALAKSDFTVDDLQAKLNNLLETTGQKPAVLFGIIRVATTWAPASPGLAETLNVLGSSTTGARLQQSIDWLSAA